MLNISIVNVQLAKSRKRYLNIASGKLAFKTFVAPHTKKKKMRKGIVHQSQSPCVNVINILCF